MKLIVRRRLYSVMERAEAIAHLRNFDLRVKAIVCSSYANDPIKADYEQFGFYGE
ncbi:MAG TPA: hypothetical protein VHY08_04230 [Bacillota bacterium]|nr:hypothetical protein [Bacillota bacterium]